MSDLRLPSQFTIIITNEALNEDWLRECKLSDKNAVAVMYLSGDNPQEDGSIVYRSSNKLITAIINPENKAVWP